jgi:protein-disulfide isomerase/thiol-disulfide isomerase/thioredoxin/uncharacterized membrane protein
MKSRPIPFLLSCAFAAAWALYLVSVHNAAIGETLSPSVLCGPEGGCGAVLASDWSTIFGVAVSAPAVPMYLLLLALGIGGKLGNERLSSLATLCGLGGAIFGGWLLYQMLGVVGTLCRYCLVMDAANLAVLATGAALHPEGVGGAAKGVLAAAARVFKPGPEGSLIPAVLAGSFVLSLAMPEPEQKVEEAVQAALEAIAEPPPAKQAPEEPAKAAENTAAAATAKTKTKTRRVVLNEAVDSIPLGADVPVKGPADAPVTIVLFEDFQCPYCRKLAGNIEGLLDQRPGDVRIAWYHFPMHSDCNKSGLKKDMHPRACAAARAAVCAHEQGRFWKMHDLLFQNSAKLSDKEIRGYARRAGVETSTFDQCLSDPATQAKVEQDAMAGSARGVSGTPNFFVNGRKLAGAQPIEALVAVVDALKKQTEEGRVLLDVEVQEEIIGTVEGTAASVSLKGPYGDFKIDAFEASVQNGSALSKPGVEPARNISWYDASSACKAAGKRLCTEEEWLTACTGAIAKDRDGDGIYSDDAAGRRHPYGTWQQSSYCASARKRDDTEPLITGNHPKCTTPEGVYDLEGLTKEWVGVTAWKAGQKGGSYYSRDSARCGYFKDQVAPSEGEGATGFRCCEGPLPPEATADVYPGGKVGDKIMDWSLPKHGGGQLGSEQTAGKPVIMTFWATWCGPCRKELPALAELYEKHKDDGLVIIGVNVDEQPAKLASFLKKTPLPFPVVLDTDSSLKARFDADTVPATYWIEKDGTIKQKTVGYDERKKPLLEEYAEGLLK